MIEIQVGDTGHYHDPRFGRSRATVVKDMGARRYNLSCPDVDFGETQHVPLDPGSDGRWFEPDTLIFRPTAEAPPAMELVPRPPEKVPMWPWLAALALSAASLGWHVVNLFGGP